MRLKDLENEGYIVTKLLNKDQTYVIYGADAYGEIALAGLRAKGIEPKYFLDRKLAGKELKGIRVLPPTKENFNGKYCYIVAAGGAYEEVCNIIKSNGCNDLMNLSDFFNMELDESQFSGKAKEFWFNRHLYQGLIHKPSDDEIYIPHVDFCTTEFCSLKCRHCSQLIPYYLSPKIIDLDYSLKCFDRFLEAIDFITEVRVLGGEPFCNVETYKVVEHLYNHRKIGKVVIYTNGTIVPGERMLKDLNEGMAFVHISDYGASNGKIKKLIQAFEKYSDIKFFVRSYDSWMDLGDTSLRDYSKEKLRRVFDSCNQRSCKHFHNDKFYSCPRVASLYRMELCGNEGEWVDFSNGNKSVKDFRCLVKDLLDRKLPYEACLRCNGALYAEQIPAAEQIK